MYRQRYLKDGYFQALPLIMEIAVRLSSLNPTNHACVTYSLFIYEAKEWLDDDGNRFTLVTASFGTYP